MRASSLPHNSNLQNQTYSNVDNSFNESPRSKVAPRNRVFPNMNMNSIDISSFAGKEIFRNEGTSRNTLLRNSFQPNGALPILKQENHETHYANNWQEFQNNQSALANYQEQQRMMQEKLRMMKYREALDQMVNQERRKKLEDVREYKEPSKTNFTEIQGLVKMEKAREKEEKQNYSNQLKLLVTQKNDQKKQEAQRKHLEEVEFKQTLSHLRQYEQLSTRNDFVPKPSFEEYKRMQQGQNDGKCHSNRESPSRQAEIRKTEYLESRYFPNPQYDKTKKIEEFISRSVRQKQEQDALEMMKRQEASKKLQQDTFSSIRSQAQEKYAKFQKDQQDRKDEHKTFLETQRLLNEIDIQKKEHESGRKKEYIDILNIQAQARKDAKLNSNILTPAEKALNYRRNMQENSIMTNNAMNSLPLEGTCYERGLQLKYIDKWLAK